MRLTQIQQQFAQYGFVKCVDFFSAAELAPIRQTCQQFHQAWIADNHDFYHSKAINSSGLTGQQYLTHQQRLSLFRMLANPRLIKLVEQVIAQPLFLNTQLFFDPVNPKQKNYWHRDPQYHLSLEQQKLALAVPQVLHIRVPLSADPGVELIPGSHKNWDTDEELQVRLERNQHSNNENLSTGVRLPLELGDLLLFSANMIHCGLYGQNRLVLDILYCENHPELTPFIEAKHQPTASMLAQLNSKIFIYSAD